jgi:sodium-dependent dicarboxylate transporter 2/3/5
VALGSALVQSGAAHWLAVQLVSSTELSAVLVIGILAAGTLVLTEGISNSAAVAVVLPIALSLAEYEGITNVKLVVFAVALPAGLAFCLPMGSPPNAITYSAGYFRLRDILLIGLVLKLAGLILMLGLMNWVWPAFGLAF